MYLFIFVQFCAEEVVPDLMVDVPVLTVDLVTVVVAV
jgi:hypothetical protein